jgi:hypothetical protein
MDPDMKLMIVIYTERIRVPSSTINISNLSDPHPHPYFQTLGKFKYFLHHILSTHPLIFLEGFKICFSHYQLAKTKFTFE